MSAIKDDAIRLIRTLPDDCTYDDIRYHLRVLEKVRRSLKSLDEGEGITESEANRIMKLDESC